MKPLLKTRIYQAKINELIDLVGWTDFYTSVKFRSDASEGKTEYTWHAQEKGSPLTTFPMRTSTMVQYFKTESGAKRNFIRRIERHERIAAQFDASWMGTGASARDDGAGGAGANAANA